MIEAHDIIEEFEGFKIYWSHKDGYYWQEGRYFETLEECRSDIDDKNRSNEWAS